MPGNTVEAGKAVLRLLIDDQQSKQKMASIQRSARNTGRKIRSAGLAIGGLGAAITAPLGAALKSFADFGDVLDKTAARTGVSVQALSELKFAAEQSGAGIAEVEKGIAKMGSVLLDAAQGSVTANDSLNELGVTLAELQNLTPEEKFLKIFDALEQVEDASQRGALAQRVFGRAGRALLPLVGNMEALRKEASALGLTMSAETATAAAEVTDAWNRAKSAARGVALQVGAALAPAFIALTDALLPAIKWVVASIQAYPELTTAAAALGIALATVGTVLGVIGVAIPLVTTGVTVLAGALVFLAANPIFLILAALAVVVLAIAAAWAWWNDEVDESADGLDKNAKKADELGASVAAANAELTAAQNRQAPQLSPELRQAIANPPGQAMGGQLGQAVGAASEVDKNIYRELQHQSRLFEEMILAISGSSGGVSVGGF